MRISERAGIQTADGEDMEVGVTWRWVLGDKLPDASLTEKYTVRQWALTSVYYSLPMIWQSSATRRNWKQWWEEWRRKWHILRRGHTQIRKKSCCLDRPTAKISVCWDAGWDQMRRSNKRIRRAGGLLARVREEFKGYRITRRTKARIVEACVKSGLLFNCATRMW